MGMEIKLIDRTPETLSAKELGIARGMVKCGMKMQDYASMLCPVGDEDSTHIPGYMGGTLRQSITFVTADHPGQTVKIQKKKFNPRVDLHGGTKETVTTDEEECVYLGTNVYYAPYVEMGTQHKHKKVDEKPFIRPAVANHEQLYTEILQNELIKAVMEKLNKALL